MGAREDFDQALREGNFAAAARAWAADSLDRDAGVEAFESKLAASLEDRQHVIGESLIVPSGEYTYLGETGKDGARLAYLPNDASLDGVTYIRSHDELTAHLAQIGAPVLDAESVVAFFTMSERQANQYAVQAEQAKPAERTAAPALAEVQPIEAQPLSVEDTLRAMVKQMGDSPELAEAMVLIASQDFINKRAYAGTLAAFGHAPYMHDQKNARNFYVTLTGPNQEEETIWGKELETALAEERLAAGAVIVLSHQGSKTVTVQVPERDSSGALTGKTVEAPAQRNSWKAVPFEKLHEMAIEYLTAQASEQGQEQAQEEVVPAPVNLPAPVADFKKRLQNATWFFDAVGDEGERASGQQSLAQIREDFKALMIDFPEEAAEVWRTNAPTEYQPELSDLLAQLENAAPEVIKVHHDHDLADASQQQEAAPVVHDAIQPAPAKGRRPAEQEDDTIELAPSVHANDKLKKHDVDAIARSDAGADAISNARPSGKGEQKDTPVEQDEANPSPKTLLNGRFVLRDAGQYFRVADGVESKRVALVDEVNKIRFVDKQMDAFQAAIELAKHKEWEAILVTGSEKFRSEAWHHARMADLEVVGYEPTEKDLATLKAAQEGHAKADQRKGVAAPTPALKPVDADQAKSRKEANDFAIGKGFGVTEAKTENGRHVGKMVHETDKHVVQDVGRKVAVVHEKASFDRAELRTAIEKGKPLKIQYDGGRAAIEGSKERSQERGR